MVASFFAEPSDSYGQEPGPICYNEPVTEYCPVAMNCRAVNLPRRSQIETQEQFHTPHAVRGECEPMREQMFYVVSPHCLISSFPVLCADGQTRLSFRLHVEGRFQPGTWSPIRRRRYCLITVDGAVLHAPVGIRQPVRTEHFRFVPFNETAPGWRKLTVQESAIPDCTNTVLEALLSRPVNEVFADWDQDLTSSAIAGVLVVR